MPFGNLGKVVPEGQNENSPAFQRRDEANRRRSPEGTAEIMGRIGGIQTSLRDSKPPDIFPGVETPGYSREVPPGLQCAAKTLNFRKPLALTARAPYFRTRTSFIRRRPPVSLAEGTFRQYATVQ